MAKQTIYTVGGTVQAGGGIYIKRKADDELLELCRQGEFAFILSSRQVGKIQFDGSYGTAAGKAKYMLRDYRFKRHRCRMSRKMNGIWGS